VSFKLKPIAALVASAFSMVPLAHADSPTDNPAVLPSVNVSASADQQPDGSRDYQPTVSTVGGKTATAVTDIPQTVNVVDKALMQAQGATSLADALRNVPGITIGGAEGGQIGNNINLRGFTARTDIYLDGFRDRGQYYRDTFDLDAVEVLQGPSSMLFGRGSTGGVINQVTKQAQLDPFTEVSGTVGTDGRLRTTYDSDSRISDNAALRVNVFGQDLQTTRDTMQNKDYGIAPTARFGIGGPTELTVSGLLQHNTDMPDYGVQSLNGSPISASRDTYYGEGTDHTDQDVAMLNTTLTHHFNDSVTLRNQTQLNHYTTDAVETAPHALGYINGAGGFTLIGPPALAPQSNGLNPSQLWVEMQSHDRNITDNSVDNQTDLISKFSTGFIHHELVVGMEAGRDTYNNQTYYRTGANTGTTPGSSSTGMVNWVSLEDPSAADPTTLTSSVGNLAQSSANSFGLYFNDTLALNDEWKVVAGLRSDTFHGEINNSAPAGVTASSPAFAKQDANFTSRRAGVLYQPTEDQSYYVSYGTSFDPLLEQMTVTNGTQALPPTNTRSYETGGKWTVLNDKLSLNAAAFNELQNNVYSASNGEYTAAGNWLIKGYTLSTVGHVTDKLQISSGYMHMIPRVVNTTDGTNGSTPANTPKDTFNIWSTYEVTHQWEIGGGPNFVSQRFVADSGISSTLPQGNIDKVSVPSYTRWDATVAYHQPRYEFRVNLLNLTNKYYYDALIQSDGGRAVPGIGRTALLTATYRFK